MIVNGNNVYDIFSYIKKKLKHIGINFNLKRGNYNAEKYFIRNSIPWHIYI